MKARYIIKPLLLILLLSFFASGEGFSAGIPVTFKGSIGFETIRLDSYRRTDNDTSGVTVGSAGNGTQEITGNASKAFLQTYLFRLNPEMVVNDHVTVKAELSSGYGRGGTLGDDATVNGNSQTFGGQFYNVTSNNSSTLAVSQFYMNIFADIATFKVGRFSKEWGLGAVFNEGNQTGDRFFTLYEGFEATFSLGKFYITPQWANISNGNDLTHDKEVKDLAISALYDNPDKDLKFGLYYGSRRTGGNNSLYQNQSSASVGSSSMTLIDVFYQKYWDKFSLGIEIPFVDGEIGDVYGTSTNQNYRATAYIAQARYQASDSWKLSLDGGFVSGDSSSNTFEAMYLHPNFHIAELMFRYNLNAVENAGSTSDLFDSAISNVTFAKLGAQYVSGLWTWNFDVIWAKANETAQNGSSFWQHEQGYYVATANSTQADDLGIELDVSFDYQWNPNLNLNGFLAYLSVGDYYAFNNSGTDFETQDQLALGMRLYLDF